MTDNLARLLDVANLCFRYEERSLLSSFRRTTAAPNVVSDVSFSIRPGETLGLVGESGSGKTTIGRLVLGMLQADTGSIVFRGQPVPSDSRRGGSARAVQVVFQNPLDSLDPRMRIGEQIEEPLFIQGLGTPPERREAAMAALRQVGLPTQIASRFPHEISGGQAQRVVIARAMVLDPQLIILDEPLSALDLSVQAQIVNLLLDLQRDVGLSYLFISHDLRMVSYLCHRVAVLFRGRIVESGPSRDVFAKPSHPYTRILLSSVPDVASGDREIALRPAGAIAPPAAEETGCAFRTRCPFADAACGERQPALRDVGEEHRVACHHVSPLSRSASASERKHDVAR